MPRLRQGGIVGILRSMREEAEGAEPALSRVHRVVSGIGDEAERMSRITPASQPATFSPADPQARPPGTEPPVLFDGSGQAINRSNLGGGAAVSSGGGSGGGGRGGSFKGGGLLQSIGGDLSAVSEEWAAAMCVLKTIQVPAGLGGIGTRNMQVWDCSGVLGDGRAIYVASGEALRFSKSSGGGAGTSSGTSIRDRPGAFDTGGAFGGRNAGGSGISGNRLDRTQGGDPTATADGLSQLGSKIDRTNTLLDKIARGDGGASFRAQGGL